MRPTKLMARSGLGAVALGAAVALTAAGCSSGSGSGGSTSGSGSAAPSTLTVWRMGASVPSQVKWMNGVVSQFHKDYPAYAKTKVKVVWVPWTNATTEFTNALSSGKNAPDITEIGNTETPTNASLGMLANISSEVNSWSGKSDLVPGMLANDTQNGAVYGVPWFGGVRGVWYRTDQFKAAGISSPPTTWNDLVSDAKKLQQKFPGTYGLGAPSNFTNGIVSFIWGAGGQVATEKNGKWTAELNSPQSEAGIKFYADLYRTQKVSPAKYIGQTELGNPGSTSGGADEDFALGKLDMYLDGPWAQASLTQVSTKYKPDWASFPIPSQNGPNPAPAFAGGSDLAVWATSKYKTADWDLIKTMDSTSNATSFANLQGFFPPYTSQLKGGAYAGNQVMSGFAKAATVTQISPLNAKNWSTADQTDQIIPTMMKSLMQGASFSATVNKANTEMQNVLNTGKSS